MPVPTQDPAAQTATSAGWEEASFTRESPTPDVTVERDAGSISSENLFNGAAAQDWRRVANDPLSVVTGAEQAARGLGFQLRGMEDLSADQRAAVRVEAEWDQSTLDWSEKLQCAAIRTATQLLPPQSESERNAQIVRHLREQSQIGDVIFVSSDGKGEPFLTEVFQTFYRRFSGQEDIDRRFPFSHVLVNIGEDKLLHLSFKGVREVSWQGLLIDRDGYDAVAVARLDADRETREAFAAEAQRFCVDRQYNYLWGTLTGPISLLERQRGEGITDANVTKNRAVCLDVATEAARNLRLRGVPIGTDIEGAVTPLDLFATPSLRVVEASALARAA